MSDIVDRLRRLAHDATVAAGEIERLRSALAAYTAGVSVGAESKPTVRIDGVDRPVPYEQNTEKRVFYDTSVVENESCPYVTGNVNFANYLQIPYVPGVGETLVITGGTVEGVASGRTWGWPLRRPPAGSR